MNELYLKKASGIFRQDYGLGNHEPVRFKSLLQELNVITLFAPLSANFSGMALKARKNDTEFHRFILVNSSQSLGKQHFTICHELYHLYIQENFTDQVCTVGLFNPKLDKNEFYADIFASHLLLPTDGILKHIPTDELLSKRVSLSTLVFIEQLYSSSRSALLYRLKKMGLVTPTDYDLYSKSVKRSALECGYPIDLYSPGNDNLVVGDYGIIAKELFNAERISESHYYSLLSDLGINLTQLENGADSE